ncbi:MAG: hypothetical protein QXI12_06330 [Candidatus Methanomethyliaceae archaeon]
MEKAKFFNPDVDEKSVNIVRKAFWLSLFIVIASGAIGYAIGYLLSWVMGCVTSRIITLIQISGALFLLWGTLFVRGWEIQTWKGNTVIEKVNRWLYISLCCIGTVIIVLSFALTQC